MSPWRGAALRRGAALLTILAIVGTLCGCGRYGRPKRPLPEPEGRVAMVRPAPSSPIDLR